MKKDQVTEDFYQKYKTIVQNANSIIMQLTPKCVIILLNQYGLDFFGYNEDEIVGKNIFGTIIPEANSECCNLSTIIDNISVNTNVYKNSEIENIRKNGERVWISWSSKALKDEKGNIREILCIGNDITGRKTAEKELIKREANLSTLLQIHKQLLDPDWKYSNFSETLEKLGKIANVSRSYIFKNSIDSEGRLLMSQTTEWCAQGIKPQIDNQDLQNLPYDFLPFWYEMLSNGKVINSQVKDLPSSVQKVLDPQNILSILVLPLTYKGKFSGFIGFDDCISYRKWNNLDISLLQSAAGAISLTMEKQRVENELKESNKRFAAVMNSIESVIYVVDMNSYEVLFLNEFSKKIFGDVEGKACWQYIQTGQSNPCKFCTNKHLIKDGKTTGIYRWEYKNTVNQRWYQIHDQAIKWIDGRIVKLVIATDIDELKRTEKALLSANKDLKARVDELAVLNKISRTITMSSDLYVALDIVTQEIGKLLNSSHAIISLIDFSKKRWKIVASYSSNEDEYTMVNIVLPDSPLAEKISKEGKSIIINNAQTNTSTLPLRSLIISRNVHSLMVVPLKKPGKVIGSITVTLTNKNIFFNSSEVKLLETIAGHIVAAIENVRLVEESKKAREEAESANKSKSQFLANMSHEIRTPMNSVLGFLSLVLDDPYISDKQRKYLSSAYSSSEKLLGLLNDILDLSKLESGKLELDNIPFDLHEMIIDTVSMLEISAKKKNLSLSYKIDKAVPKIVVGDSGKLRQILINLAGNAIKFTEKGDVNICVNLENKNDMIHFSVSDTGIGIPPERLNIIFDPFTQADASTTRKYGGTGLGTTISRQISELMGGKIWVESDEGKGSTFHFTVNMKATKEKPVRKIGYECFGLDEDDSVIKLQRCFKILLAEDIEENIILAKIRLEEKGHNVIVARDGLKALDIFQKETIDVILMDVHMPQMNGLEATRQIRQKELEESKEPTPIIALTASLMKEERDRCYKAGMDMVVGKPIDFDQLFRAMEKVITPWFGNSNNKHLEIKKESDKSNDIFQLDGIDTKKGLKTWTNKDTYIRALISFSNKFKDAPEQISQYIKNQENEKAQSLAHSLKGISGNLSVYDVYKASMETDAAIQKNQKDEIEKHLKSLKSAMKIVNKSIQKINIKDDKKDTKKKDLNIKELSQIFKEMIVAFEEHNPDFITPYLKKLENYLQPEQLAPLRKQLNLYDFIEAKAEAMKLANVLSLF